LAVSMPTATILKKSTLKGTTSHGIWYSYKISSGLISRCHGHQGAKNNKFSPNWTVQRILLRLDTKIDHHSKLCSFF
jgi:ribosomal protein L35AE/L33A